MAFSQWFPKKVPERAPFGVLLRGSIGEEA